jgi:multiple sugar transport system substrate-binding protein
MVGGRNAFQITPDTMKFMQGQAAMAIGSQFLMEMLQMESGGQAAQRVVSGEGPEGSPPRLGGFDWDVVTLPVDPIQPDVTDGIGLDSIFAINAASRNVPAAWEFLKYANGEQLAKTSGKSGPQLSSRIAYKKEVEGKNVDAFYALGINDQLLLERLPDGFAASFARLASEQIQNVVNGAVSLDDALQTLQSRGQDLLTQAGLE